MDIAAASFSGHESFPLRHTWLTKGVMGCSQDPLLFTREDAMVSLGVGKNMVRSIRHWCLATKMIEEDPTVRYNRGSYLRPTFIGSKLFLSDEGWDPYLEDAGTLWLIHWLLATNATRATTWYFAFNALHQPDFTRSGLERAIVEFAQRLPNVRASEGTLRRDVDVFIRTYAAGAGPTGQAVEDTLECPLVELGLIYEQTGHNLYTFSRGPKATLPDAVFVYALWDYANHYTDQHTLTFDELAYAPMAVGRVFKLDEPSLAERLERLADLTNAAWQFSETAGFKQVVMVRSVDSSQLLAEHYGQERTAGLGAAS
jgi:hypothetical protein